MLLKEKDKPRKERARPVGKWQKDCDRLMQELGRKKFPHSLLSGQPTQVMHHFFPKSVCARLRYDWDNLIPLTNAEHMRLHQSGDPDYEQRIVEIKGREWYEKLREKRREMIKVTVSYYREVKERLQEELRDSSFTREAD